MDNWAIGMLNEKARVFVRSSEPTDVLAQMQTGEIIAPVDAADRGKDVRLLGNMKYEVMVPNAADSPPE